MRWTYDGDVIAEAFAAYYEGLYASSMAMMYDDCTDFLADTPLQDLRSDDQENAKVGPVGKRSWCEL
ncbi:hypothetical protein NDU88_004553 [Pleurodeles waltl]|uniref:Uncharacterized protein n=1 Tax=Pleurodeles waltl TaxID=8319 RepID=A0AAV7TTW8_PLEWA|nr:hypothetical protein NDU88_004553 [Pleurodeles waltl]